MERKLVAALTIIVLIVLSLLAFMFSNSSGDTVSNESENSMEGIIAQIKEGQILLVRGLTSEEINELLSEQEIITRAESATYFELTQDQQVDNLKIGMAVRVWYENLDTSNPAYGVSKKVEILD